MKKLIIILGCILLGLYIFKLILNDNSSIKKAAEEKLKEGTEYYQPAP